MLKFKKEGNIIKVLERLPDFNFRVIQYDMEKKLKKVDEDPWYPMDDSCIAWVEKYYLPKVAENCTT